MLNDFKRGQKVKVTSASWQTAYDSNRATAYPSDTFLELFKARIDEIGEILYRHLPGYEVTVIFQDKRAFHCKDNWLEPA
jgi:hypothetical protein